jgi:hypothetical protein
VLVETRNETYGHMTMRVRTFISINSHTPRDTLPKKQIHILTPHPPTHPNPRTHSPTHTHTTHPSHTAGGLGRHGGDGGAPARHSGDRGGAQEGASLLAPRGGGGGGGAHGGLGHVIFVWLVGYLPLLVVVYGGMQGRQAASIERKERRRQSQAIHDWIDDRVLSPPLLSFCAFALPCAFVHAWAAPPAARVAPTSPENRGQ